MALLTKASQSAAVSNTEVFKNRLNCPKLSHCRKLTGNVIYKRGPAAAKHQSPKLLGKVVDEDRDGKLRLKKVLVMPTPHYLTRHDLT